MNELAGKRSPMIALRCSDATPNEQWAAADEIERLRARVEGLKAALYQAQDEYGITYKLSGQTLEQMRRAVLSLKCTTCGGSGHVTGHHPTDAEDCPDCNSGEQ